MKVVLAGAFGNLGTDVLKELIKQKYEVVALDLAKKEVANLDETKYSFHSINACDKATLAGVCDGADAVISTIGLTGSSTKFTHYDIDYQGNLNLLEEAKKTGVKNFVYISVIKADQAKDIPMLDAKAKFEQKLKESGLTYVIHRPTGYFYDIAKVFMPMIENGKVTLLGHKAVHANVIATEDFAEFIVQHLLDKNAQYNVGGKETYSYEEIAKMFFEAAGKKPVIKRAPAFLFDLLAKAAKKKKNGKEAVIKFSKWTLTNEMIGDTTYGSRSFKSYIQSRYMVK
jgi:uncharacterized protein YbjT (DUF2867 family)